MVAPASVLSLHDQVPTLWILSVEVCSGHCDHRLSIQPRSHGLMAKHLQQRPVHIPARWPRLEAQRPLHFTLVSSCRPLARRTLWLSCVFAIFWRKESTRWNLGMEQRHGSLPCWSSPSAAQWRAQPPLADLLPWHLWMSCMLHPLLLLRWLPALCHQAGLQSEKPWSGARPLLGLRYLNQPARATCLHQLQVVQLHSVLANIVKSRSSGGSI